MFSGEMGYSLFRYPISWATLQGKYRGTLHRGGSAEVRGQQIVGSLTIMACQRVLGP